MSEPSLNNPATRGLRLMSARRAAASLRDSRFSRASLERAEVLELLRSIRVFCFLGCLLAANDAVPFDRSRQIKVRDVRRLRILSIILSEKAATVGGSALLL
jgi:hypothetical protein